ncbi:hypothetical protein [Streptomyces sp. VRA16 Mangrove soil]|uniref:hypothetical protein n=1 Tax=Streptomyces sp. VRA16 Mangrove soil TaxID=2817434 RepID=UPI001A9ECBD4|nr:hypothetical protein [Streptomyces sp. VRA16 Mangrove soil]MBO1338033.1 hypothetical protein [Streptomyces sp. VRA16 Mangrove soil]
MRVAPVGGTAVQDHVALAEIELCGELIIAASAVSDARLSADRIDEVLRVAEAWPDGPDDPYEQY